MSTAPAELPPPSKSTRILLAATETRVRMHLRRILASCGGVEVIGHVRPGMTLADALQRGGADLLLADAMENPGAVAVIVQDAARLRLRTIVPCTN